MNIADIGYRLVQRERRRSTSATKSPAGSSTSSRATKHFDRRITVTTPLQKAGAYLVTAKVADGNTSQDRPLARRHGDRPQADGRQVVLLRRRRRHRRADRQGQRRVLRLPAAAHRRQQLSDRHQELRRAHRRRRPGIPADPRRRKTDSPRISNGSSPPPRDDGRLAYLGFHNVWRGHYYDAQYNEVKTFAITDRPVYRPGQTVQFKFWIRQRPVRCRGQVAIRAPSRSPSRSTIPRARRSSAKRSPPTTTAASPASSSCRPTPRSASISCIVVNRGGGTFRVEEYKKPEFEVTVDAPTEPVHARREDHGHDQGEVLLRLAGHRTPR